MEWQRKRPWMCRGRWGVPLQAQAHAVLPGALPVPRERRSAGGGRFADLYLEYLPRILNYVRFRVGDEEVAQDLTARVFERALAKRHTLRDEGAFGGWLFRIAHNTVAEHYRRTRPQVSLEAAAESGIAFPSGEPSPEAEALRYEEAQVLWGYIRRLPDRDREIVSLKFMGGLRNQEIARITGLTPNHVGVLLFRALRKLRQMMEDEIQD